MQNLQEMQQAIATAPCFHVFQTVWIYYQDDLDQGCFDKGVVVGYRLPEPVIEAIEWWYLVWFDVYPRNPRLVPFVEWCSESDLIALANSSFE